MAEFVSTTVLAQLTYGSGHHAHPYLFPSALGRFFHGIFKVTERHLEAHRPVFDWTVNLGHILTFLGFIGSGLVAYQVMDKRITVLEQAAINQIQRDAAQDVQAQLGRAEIREALRDVRVSVEKLGERSTYTPRNK